MGKKLDAMKAAAGGGKKTPASGRTQPHPAGSPPRVEPSAGKSAKSTATVLTFRCGHTDQLENFQRANCPACKNAAKRKKNADKKAKREAEQAVAPPSARGRLPVGSAFEAFWDGTAWTGNLTVPGVELEGPKTASGVKPLLKLMRLLDDDYRAATAPFEAEPRSEEAIRAADAVVNGREPD